MNILYIQIIIVAYIYILGIIQSDNANPLASRGNSSSHSLYPSTCDVLLVFDCIEQGSAYSLSRLLQLVQSLIVYYSCCRHSSNRFDRQLNTIRNIVSVVLCRIVMYIALLCCGAYSIYIYILHAVDMFISLDGLVASYCICIIQYIYVIYMHNI